MENSSAVPVCASLDRVRSWFVEDRPSLSRSGVVMGAVCAWIRGGWPPTVLRRAESERVKSIEVGRRPDEREGGVGGVGEVGDVGAWSVMDSFPISKLWPRSC